MAEPPPNRSDESLPRGVSGSSLSSLNPSRSWLFGEDADPSASAAAASASAQFEGDSLARWEVIEETPVWTGRIPKLPDPETGGATKPAFRMRRPIGKGGFGEVWEGVQVSLGRIVAIKRLRQDIEAELDKSVDRRVLVSMFRQEALTAASLEHPNIVPVHDLGQSPDGAPLLAMKLVRGEPWEESIRREFADYPVREFLARQLPTLIAVSQAVAFAHYCGIIHRDLKPSQVMIGQFGEVYLMDWGLAVVYDTARAEAFAPGLANGRAPTLATASCPAGTPALMAPEQTHKDAYQLGPWTDIYLLGGTLYYLLTGICPHQAADAHVSFEKASKGLVTPPRLACPPGREVPEELADLAMKALSPDPRERLPTARHFLERLQEYLTGAGRRREAEELTKSAAAALSRLEADRPKLSVGEVYARHTEIGETLARARALWPESPQAAALHAHNLAARITAEIQQNDLIMARFHLEQLEKDPLPGDVNRHQEHLKGWLEEAGARRQMLRRQRIVSGWLAVMALVALLIVSLIAFFSTSSSAEAERLSRQEVEMQRDIARAERDKTELARRDAEQVRAQALAAREAERLAKEEAIRARNETEAQLFFAQVGLAARFVGDSRWDLALEQLREAPAHMRSWEWGYLVASAHPELLRLAGHTGPVTFARFSPDGYQAITTSADEKAMLWDLRLGTRLSVLSGHTGPVVGGDLSYDGRRAVTAGEDGSVRLWHAPTGRELTRLVNGGQPIRSVTFSSDATMILIAGADRMARLLDGESGREIQRYEGHRGAVNWAAFSPDGGRIATASEDRTVRVYKTETGTLLMSLDGHGASVEHVEFSPDGRFVATAANDGTARVWELASGRESQRLAGHQSAFGAAGVLCVGWSPDGRRLATSSQDETIRLWDVQTGRELYRLTAHSAAIRAVTFSPDGTRLLTASTDGTARLWQASTGRRELRLTGHAPNTVWEADFDKSGMRVVTAGWDATARVWDTSLGYELLRIEGHGNYLFSVAYAPDDRSIATASEDGTIRVWDAVSGRELTRIQSNRPFRGVRFSPDGTVLLSASADGTARVWDPVSGRELRVLHGHSASVFSARFDPSGTKIATASADGTACLWDAATGEEKGRMGEHTGAVFFAEFNPAGDLLVTACEDKIGRVWDAKTLKLRTRLVGHSGAVLRARFSPDGLRIATASEDGTARIWDVGTGRELLRYSESSGPIYDARFDAQGMRLILTSRDHPPRIYEAFRLPEKATDWVEPMAEWKRRRYAALLESWDRSPRPEWFWRLSAMSQTTVGRGGPEAARLLDEIARTLATYGREAEPVRNEVVAAAQRLGELASTPQEPIHRSLLPVIETLDGFFRVHPTLAQRATEEPTSPLSQEPALFGGFVSEPLTPIPWQELYSIPEAGTDFRILVFINRDEPARSVSVAGSLPEWGWLPNRTPLRRLGNTESGVVWELRAPFRQAEFKFTYGRPGEDWGHTEEWQGLPNRVIPSPTARVFRESNGGLVYLAVFGRAP